MEEKLSFLQWFGELEIYLGEVITKAIQNAADNIGPIPALLAILLIPLGIKFGIRLFENI